MPYSQKHPNPRVIVVGAGIGGLMMGLLLGKAGITYQIFERSANVKALVFSRPELYDILLRQIPKDRISFNKRILSMRRSAGGTRIYCSDNSIYEGDIVIGADGAYSAVRHNMHKMMKADEGVAPVQDVKDMAMPYMCMVGTTGPMDPVKYPQLSDPLNHLHHVIGTDIHSWTVITIPKNRFCWSVMVQVKDQAEAKEQRFRNSEWGPEANNPLIDEVKDFPITFGGTLGDVIKATPKDRISKVMLEEKLFETWHYRNVVLIGDGAMNAMQDAVVLANCLYDLKDLSPESLTAAFEDYKSQRYKEAKKQVANSKLNARVSSGQTFVEKIVRHLILNFVPTSVKARQFSKAAAYRPQVAFLPSVTDRGLIKALPNRPSKRAMYEEMLLRKRDVVLTPYEPSQAF
ncbi:FAD/NAD(P)-binding domain-containing protein [Linnemannia elongata AG-77]|uniref:FAD/NAD(P)-binding domain-containing protein n=1 Tax=Linnemannia elongata AG-77 TaxID=1314771 RepID=A0A197JNR2_9FUNG|nr:FAD/NAD(P)-binding domain-containing protein [Linnemannia elongata AG-77]